MDSDSRNITGFALAFETSGAIGGVALGRGDAVLEARRFSAPMRHALEFLPTIKELCRTYDVPPNAVETVHVSIGPGSFTGLRIAATVARTMALAAERSSRCRVQCTAVPTLEIIAQNALDASSPPKHVAVLLDAKRARTYAARFHLNGGRYVPHSEPVETDPVSFLESCPGDTAVLGDGARVYREVIATTGRVILPDELFPPHAETAYVLGARLAALGAFVAPRDLVPLYIRPPEAEERWARRHQQQ